VKVKVIIPTKGRADIIGKMSLRLLPDATLCVGDDEVDEYAKVSDNLLVHPANVVGMGPLRQWILDHVEDRIVVMADDDIGALYDQTGFHKRRIEDPAHVMAVIERAAIAAHDAGCAVFGWTQCARPVGYRPLKPISFVTWVGTVVGVIGRDLAYDTKLTLRGEDVDLCMQTLLKHRILWCDDRYYWQHAMFKLKGGNCLQRSAQGHREQVEYMLRKWGRYLTVKPTKTGSERFIIRVTR